MSSAVGFPSKSGGVNLEDYTTNGMILEFTPIAASLQTEFDKKGSNPVLEARHISEFTASVINFQDKHCGINSPYPRPFTRFPFEIFRDYNLHGHLHRLLRFMISYCVKQQWYREKYTLNQDNTSRLLINLNDNTLSNEYYTMFKQIESQLQKQRIIKAKNIYFSPLISVHSQQKLAEIARNHGATISDQLTNTVTHIILPNNADMEDSGEEHVRTVDKEENLAYIHYWFYPSSYDEWISNDLIDGDAEHIEPPDGAWRVAERWITDLERFNEWMVEIDYEVLDENTPEAQYNNNNTANATQITHNIVRNGNYNNNNTNASNSKSRKRKREVHDTIVIDEVEADDPDGDWIPPSKKAKRTHIDIDMEEENKSMSSNINAKKTLKFTLKRSKNTSTHSGGNVTSQKAIKREIALCSKGSDPVLNGGDLFPFCGSSLSRIRPSISSYPIVIPSYARWFRLDRIHPLEYSSLYTLFGDKSMQYHERYLEIRNFMVNSYRINPRIYLTVSASRRMIAADAGCVYRIHEFLEHWGLVNYQCDDGSIPEFEPVMMDYTHIETPFGVKIATKIKENETKKSKITSHKTSLNLRERENMFCGDHINDLNESNDGNNCVFCGLNCFECRYRCNIESELILCSRCFESKRYSMMFNENDFFMDLKPIITSKKEEEREDRVRNVNICSWNDDEIKKLKYAIKTYHDDWKRVAQYVGRNEDECIAQFIQLPINDAFIDNVENKNRNTESTQNQTNNNHMLSFLNRDNGNGNSNNKCTLSPFNDASHPILAECGALSAIVDSELVNIASSAALQFISKQKVIEATQLKVNDAVETKMGRGIVEQIEGNGALRIKFEWGEANLSFSDIIDRVSDSDIDGNDGNIGNWQQYPQNVSQSKAKAAGILAISAVIAKALKNHKDSNVEQLLQHLVLLQSQKVKAKVAHFEQLCNVLNESKGEIETMKQELLRERIEIAKQRLGIAAYDDVDNDDDGDDDDIDIVGDDVHMQKNEKNENNNNENEIVNNNSNTIENENSNSNIKNESN